MHKIKIPLFSMAAIVSFPCLAQDLAIDSYTTAGAQASFGRVNHDDFGTKEDTLAQVMLYADFHVSSEWAIGGGVNYGENVLEWVCEYAEQEANHCSDRGVDNNTLKSDLTLSNLFITLRYEHAMTQSISWYSKLGGHYYNYEITDLFNDKTSEDGLGGLAETGFQFTLSKKYSVNLGLQYWDMGKLSSKTTTLGFSYQF